MKLPGFCTHCRKPKQVRVSAHNLAMNRMYGICDACQQAEDDKRKEKR